MGAEGSYFWAFADTGGGSSWNKYASERTSYAPVFLDERTLIPGKHMEAILEGAQDHACREFLARKVEELREKPGVPEALLQEAERLLSEAPDRILGAPGARDLQWRTPKDRSIADQVRREIFMFLQKNQTAKFPQKESSPFAHQGLR